MASNAASAESISSLLRAAAHGLFPCANQPARHSHECRQAAAEIMELERRDYSIRQCALADLDVLKAIEDVCWPQGTAAPKERIQRRIEQYPAGQMLIEFDGVGVGVVYTQRIEDANLLWSRSANDVEEIHRDGAAIVQLLAINVLPSLQHRQFGDQLLEFMLQVWSLSPDVAQVVGVTRCRNYAAHGHLSFPQYVHARGPNGQPLDSMIRFHRLHGGRVQGVIERYRPDDQVNRGYGVLIAYAPGEPLRLSRTDEQRSAHPVEPPPEISRTVASLVCGLVPTTSIDALALDVPFSELGLNSADLLALSKDIDDTFRIALHPTFFFEKNTVRQVTDFLEGKLASRAVTSSGIPCPERSAPATHEVPQADAVPTGVQSDVAQTESTPTRAHDIAIVGMSLRFPGSIASAEQFWDLLVSGGSVIGSLPNDRWSWPHDIDPERQHVGIDKGGFLDDLDQFDAPFFRLLPKEVELMDPQHRIMLELAWNCLEDAAVAPSAIAGSKTGVFIGASSSDYRQLISHSTQSTAAHAAMGTSNSLLPNRISYFLDLRGPSVQLDTACSSSLVAISDAVQAIRSGQCIQALAGGINVICHPGMTLGCYAAGMLAKDGQCKTFDAAADGYVRSEGGAMVLLKPLSAAIEAGDHIYGVIRGVAVNHGGLSGGLTVPNPERQSELIRAALTDADAQPADISYVEAHGTGTALGDPIEIRGLRLALDVKPPSGAEPVHRCGVGSVKTNVGHLEAASGIAGLIKVVLCMKHGTLPGLRNYRSLNPRVDLADSSFYPVVGNTPWLARNGRQRCAGVSSFGWGGANAHVIVQEYLGGTCGIEETATEVEPTVIVLSAKTKSQLDERIRQLVTSLQEQADPAVAHLAFTLQVGREAMPHRLAVTARTRLGLLAKLQSALLGGDRAEGVYRGSAQKQSAELKRLLGDATEETRAATCLESHDYENLAELWVWGLRVDWRRLYTNPPARISLPGYPFARERYWIPPELLRSTDSLTKNVAAASAENVIARARSEDLVHSSRIETKILRRTWTPLEAAGPSVPSNVTSTLGSRCVLLDPEFGNAQLLIARHPAVQVEVLQHSDNMAERIFAAGRHAFLRLQEILQGRPKRPVLVQVVVSSESHGGSLSGALSGLLKSAGKENPLLLAQVIEVPPTLSPVELDDVLVENARSATEAEVDIRYVNAARQVMKFAVADAPDLRSASAESRLPWTDGGVYLITGGAGGLGLIFAREIASRVREAKLVLLGRSPLSAQMRSAMSEIEQADRGTKVDYQQVDVADEDAVRRCVAQIVDRYGHLDGVMHSAGVIQDGFIIKKSPATLQSVLAPKIDGTINIDRATAHLPLRVFVLFSSVAGVFGNLGQSDYALGNAFLDRYADYRRRLTDRGERSGRVLSIAWPLWEHGGMQVDAATLEQMRRDGLHPMPTSAGIEALYRAWNGGESQVVVLTGERRGIDSVIGKSVSGAVPFAEPSPQAAMHSSTDDDPLRKAALLRLKGVFSRVTKLGLDRIDVAEPLETYGIDSIMIVQLNAELGKTFAGLPKTVFYEYQSLEALSEYLIAERRAECLQWTETAARRQASNATVVRRQGGAGASPLPIARSSHEEGIAIIGLSGRYPHADDVDQYWENLRSGKHCIDEVPRERWSLKGFYEADVEKAIAQGKSYSKWGGFLSGFADFDSLFFNISPREAANMDPQERVFLQACWSVLEDAGYTRETLARRYQGRVGVYAGITKTGYGLYGPALWQQGNLAYPHTTFSSVANRVSYVLDLHGPSMPIDTMCSASLTAIHEACEHLRRGECELAIAGGVNLYLHPSSYVAMCGVRMLSADGRCKSFGAGGDGIVPGEGVGAVLLKPLSRAIADRDHIYGVIKGTSINHGGKTNGYTVPNPVAQRELVAKTLSSSGIDPRAISYVEAHGTGTALGDPIEVTGLTQAFARFTTDTQFCAIGSVKSSIGHLESAAGIAGLTKILLQMKHGQLAPTLHAATLNPNIDFAHTPFVVQRELEEWQRPVLETDGLKRECPRTASISSFGAGGANAHAIVEEFCETDTDERGAFVSDHPALIVLSAKTDIALQEQARKLYAHVSARPLARIDLHDIAHTLQVGREAMDQRLAFSADSIEALKIKLANYLANGAADDAEDVYRGEGKRHKDVMSLLGFDEALHEWIPAWVSQGKHRRVLELWVKGAAVDWSALYEPGAVYGQIPARRVSLPTYPFAREPHWIPISKELASARSVAGVALHPLLHRNTSDLLEQRFTSTFAGSEFFFDDHVVQGRRVWPGVAHLEMARAALAHALPMAADPQAIIVLSDVAWSHPVSVADAAIELSIGLHAAAADGEVSFRIYSTLQSKGEAGARPADDITVHSRGRASITTSDAQETLDLAGLRSGCFRSIDARACYAAFDAMGVHYGPGFRCIESAWAGTNASGERYALAKMVLPSCLADAADRFVLHPAVMDGALQAALVLSLVDGVDAVPLLALPFALEKLEVIKGSPTTAWVHVTATSGRGTAAGLSKLNFDICDEEGRVCVRLRGLTVRPQQSETAFERGGARRELESGSTFDAPVGDEVQQTGSLRTKMVLKLRKLVAEALQLTPERLELHVGLEQYGLDSVAALNIVHALEGTFDRLPKTLLFEYQTIDALADYFVEIHAQKLLAVHGSGDPLQSASQSSARSTSGSAAASAPAMRLSPRKAEAELEVAIIGIAGRYPQSADLDEFWATLRQGKDCITEIPRERWDYRDHFDPQKGRPGKSYSRWGGFIDGVDEFDARFFNISPREAQMMDPQERLFLQCVYQTLEDAGYTRDALNRNVGVFVGVMYEEYQLYAAQAQALGHPYVVGGSPSSIANRVSYFCDFQGPSMAVDTMCSSSLTAIHLACQSLRSGECAVAIAGGVNVSIHPNKYLVLSQGGFASSAGRCESFGDGGDGYVPGEGVGAVLLKPLQQAIADRDHIYGVVKGTSINHGGKTNGYTVPNPRAQAKVIAAALKQAHVHPRAISYVEAHGTGTALGDPIEIAGLTQAFSHDTADVQYCAIGSAKSNIGHLESAAGIAGLTKVLLQMQQGMLVPSLHSSTLNPLIDFDSTPFKVQQGLEAWRPPVVTIDGETTECPRIAGISSFGAGGANAHVIIEEYPAPNVPVLRRSPESPWLIVLSANNEEGLHERARQLLEHLIDRPYSGADLGSIAYTLQVGREAMDHRLAFTSTSLEELQAKLGAYLGGRLGELEDAFCSDVGQHRDMTSTLNAEGALQAALANWLMAGKHGIVLDLWVKGITFDWASLYVGAGIYSALQCRRVSLPVYRFARERHWLEVHSLRIEADAVDGPTPRPPAQRMEYRGTTSDPQDSATVSDDSLAQHVRETMKVVIATALKMDLQTVEGNARFSDYGLDSLIGLEVVERLKEALPIEVNTTSLFDYETLNKLAAHVVSAHGEALRRHVSMQPVHAAATPAIAELPSSDARTARADARAEARNESISGVRERIAVIGISGRFAKANTVEELWAHLARGDDLVEDVSRGHLAAHFTGDLKLEADQCRTGGFLRDVDRFDALFFSISGLEATYMDPQQRLFLEEAWKALEDAGYAGASIRGRRCGVYVGHNGSDYPAHERPDAPAQAMWGGASSILPARIAYHLDLQGPAIAIDTACSSSLVAIHLACQGLWNRETDVALAGGVHVQSTPAFYAMAHRAGMLSPTGRCHAFDDRADGFVPSEGVGVVVLKRLSDALADGDHIYGVIRGSGINQDGATNGITAPSALSQERLERDVYESFGIHPEEIQLVEAHGTGTKLGDPIEWQALTNAFRKDTDRRHFCAIGSIKTNIGHATAAAGVAGFIKALLALEYRQLPPSLHFEQGNRHIDFADSPFYINTALRPWNVSSGQKRTAAVSAFGFSGTNAHVVVEEAPALDRDHASRPSYLIVLSARTAEQLADQAERLLRYCDEDPSADCGNISYTLLLGREHLNHRLACLVRGTGELAALLKEWIEQGSASNVMVSVLNDTDVREQASLKRHGNDCIEECRDASVTRYAECISIVADLYVRGYDLNFKQLFVGQEYSRLSLPTYPFAGDRYWAEPHSSAISVSLHPLLQRNSSDLSEQRFSSTLAGEEFFLRDHVVNGRPMLPGVAYLEIARAAVHHSTAPRVERAPIILKNMAWIQPIVVTHPLDVHIGLRADENEQIEFRIYSDAGTTDQEHVVHATGYAMHVAASSLANGKRLNLPELQSRCERSIDVASCYVALREAGIEHGASFRALTSVAVGHDESGGDFVLAHLALPLPVLDGADEYVLHPSVLDGALQAAVALSDLSSAQASHRLMDRSRLALPFSLEQLEIAATPPHEAVAYVRPSTAQGESGADQHRKIDIDICDVRGVVCVRLSGLTLRLSRAADSVAASRPSITSGASERAAAPSSIREAFLMPCWEPCVASTVAPWPAEDSAVLLVGGSEEQQALWRRRYAKLKCLLINSQQSPESIAAAIGQQGVIDHVVWVSPQEVAGQGEALIAAQATGVIGLFRLIKALLASAYGARKLELTVITWQTLSITSVDPSFPAHASVHGLVGSLAKEYADWKIRLLDLPLEQGAATTQWVLEDILTVPADARGDAWAYRAGAWYRQLLIPCELPASAAPSYRHGGVYVIVGGAGGIGAAFSEHLIRRYQARVVWIGRREQDADIAAKIDQLSKLGPAPIYIRADASDVDALTRAYREIKARYAQVHGLVHAAIALLDRSLALMDEARFTGSLVAKVDVPVRLAQVFAAEALDFVLHFSSLQSFTKAAGQSNYAAGCTFADAFAHQLRLDTAVPVKVMNWGYWGSVGVVASPTYRARLAQYGLASIEPNEGMDALERLMCSPASQLVYLKATSGLLSSLASDGEQMVLADRGLPALAHRPSDGGKRAFPEAYAAAHDRTRSTLESILSRLLCCHLHSLGLLGQTTERQMNLSAAQLGWLAESRRVLERAGYISLAGGDYRISDPAVLNAASAWSQWDAYKSAWLLDAHLRAQVQVVDASIRALPQILAGKRRATDVLFPGSSMKLVEGIYKHNAGADFFNDVLCDSLIEWIDARLQQDPGARIRILEIGAGTGGTSERAFERLRGCRESIAEYRYTDLSKAFLMHAEQVYGASVPYLQCSLFNVERPVAQQGFELGAYDIVIAANVLHATAYIQPVLRNVKALLKRHGLLLLNEISGNSLFTHLTFGLLDGWWLAKDSALRVEGTPALAPASWYRVLAAEGFQNIRFPAQVAHERGQQVIAAESDGMIRQPLVPPRSWSTAVRGAESAQAALPKTAVATVAQRSNDPEQRNRPSERLRERVGTALKRLVSATLQIPVAALHELASLESYGIDSILVLKLTQSLRASFPDISNTLLFEYRTIAALAAHIVETYPSHSHRWVGTADEHASGMNLDPFARPRLPSRGRRPRGDAPVAEPSILRAHDIAIIGLSGRYPQADTVHEFWESLKAGKNCITEIPPTRWDHEQYFDPRKGAPGKTYSKWGGFVSDIDRFDPLFFRISPQEAQQMDPQERLFLQQAYAAIQDAGYTPAGLCESRKIGVYVGVMNSTYSRHSTYWSIANRVSYLFDCRGPSMAVDTACSSSLTALHLAVESLRSGTCEYAIAGGVNLIVDPVQYTNLAAMAMLASDDRCKSFGAQADGFVDGEGVGVVVLKSLEKAIADGDAIYGVIKGTSINHGGLTNGYTVPNPQAQADAIATALADAQVDPRTISYIEAHGTGTALGDPIEIAGLTRAFSKYTQDAQFCAVGSAKSTIGHLESAAGIAGLTKVLLQMKYGQLAPSLHADVLNPHIEFSKTPFVVQRELTAWSRPRLWIDGQETEHPRIAGISSFGAGGANAHLIVAEYIGSQSSLQSDIALAGRPAMVVLSARTEESLRESVLRLQAHLRREGHTDEHLAAIAYTLQVGREALDHRLAFVVGSVRELQQKLASYLEGGREIDGYYVGTARQHTGAFSALVTDEDLRLSMQQACDACIEKGKYETLLGLWVQGLPIAWERLYANGKPRRLSLPTYPFARERHWKQEDVSPAERSKPAVQHSMQDTVTSPRDTARASDTSQGSLREHVQDIVAACIAASLKLDVAAIDEARAFSDYGMDSILAIRVVDEINRALSIDLTTSSLFDYASLARLSAHIVSDHEVPMAPTVTETDEPTESTSAPESKAIPIPAAAVRRASEHSASHTSGTPATAADAELRVPIAIIGLSARYPRSPTAKQLWMHLAEGADLVEEVTRWDLAQHLTAAGLKPDASCLRGGFVSGIEEFDPAFFNISAAEAKYMDPQQRLFLEEAWNALEDAGYVGEAIEGRQCGVYAGCSGSDYHKLVGNQPPAQAMWGNAASILSARIAYHLNLRGPAITIDTACSSSLVAIHVACQSLRSGEIELALAGGVALQCTPSFYEMGVRAGMLSPSGRCSAFDERADGFVPGEGVGVIVLKRLSEALADGDHVYGVIQGSGVNQDGATNGITAPSSLSQESLQCQVYDRFGIHPEEIQMVEAHGTGTKLGDPIEHLALMKTFRRSTERKQYCALGSIKTNLGHTTAAAGVAGVTKVLLSLQHEQIPPSLHYERGNPQIDFENSPFYVNTRLQPWKAESGKPRCAAVSSFGFSGTNAHVVISEAPAVRRMHSIRPAYLIVLSAREARELREQVALLLAHCQDRPDIDCGNISYTLLCGRKHFKHRLACIAATREELIRKLGDWLTLASTADVLVSGQKEPDRQEQSSLQCHDNRCIARCRDSHDSSDYLEHLAAVAESYVQGQKLQYSGLFAGDRYSRLPLPTYPLTRTRHWVDGEQPYSKAAPTVRTDDGQATTALSDSTQERPEGFARRFLSQVLELPEHAIDPRRDLLEYGVDSIVTMQLTRALEAAFGAKIAGREMSECRTIDEISRHLEHKINRPESLNIPGRDQHVRPMPAELRLPLSQGQAGLWMLQTLQPGSSAYNIPLCMQIDGAVDVPALRHASDFLLQQHPMLATTLHVEGGAPVLVGPIADLPALQSESVDGMQEQLLKAYLRGKAREPFVLQGGPLLRLYLLSQSAQKHFLLIVAHHIIIDRGSAKQLVNTLFDAYARFSRNLPLSLKAAATSYGEFVEWEQNMLSSADGEAHRTYWMQQLAGPLPTLELYADRSRKDADVCDGRSHAKPLTTKMAQRISAFCIQRRINPSVLFLSLYSILLHRYTGETDVIVGMPVMNRPDARFDSVVGYFINMVAIRTRIGGAETCTDVLRSTQLTLADAVDHAAYPFARVVRDLDASGQSQRSPVFQVAFEYQNAAVMNLDRLQQQTLGVAATKLLGEFQQEGEYELVLEVIEHSGTFELKFKYDAALFEHSAIVRMAEQYEQLLHGALMDPEQHIRALSLIGEEERRLITREFNATAASYPHERLLHELFETQAQRTPDAIAVAYGDQQLTYEVLNIRANRLAGYLRKRRVTPRQLVGLCVARGPEMMVAVLGVLKAGGAYVPLDPDFPTKRLESMLTNAAPQLVLTQTSLEHKLALTNVPIVNLDLEKEEIDRCDGANPDSAGLGFQPTQLAYVIYTSGSTGQPKGVAVAHREIINLVYSMQRTFGVGAQDRMLGAATLSFDMATLDVYLPILTGATLVLVDRDTAMDASALATALDTHAITIFQATPATWRLLLAAGWAGQPQLKALCGGEAMTTELAQQLCPRVGELWNMYGPTETTVWSCCRRVEAPLIDTGRIESVGRPIANTQVYILDEHEQLVPIGAVGEIHIGGAGVSRGYWQRPDLTAERFVDDPYSADPTARLYKTGDRGRWRPDGDIEYLGRNDFQVKVRGFRIELGEIESQLDGHPCITAAVVAAQEDAQGNVRILAYFTSSASIVPRAEELRSFLKETLPEYMLPSAFVWLPKIPLTANAKVNRAELPLPDASAYAARQYEAPRGAVERILAGIWQEMLDLEQVGREDNFFELGGYSLLAMLMMERIQSRLGCDISVGVLFKNPTVRAFALAIQPTHGVVFPGEGSVERAPANDFYEEGTV